MYDPCPIKITSPITQINLGNGVLDILNLKSVLEKALSCMKRCSKKRKRRLPCANCEPSHYTGCNNFIQIIISVQNVVAEALGTTGNKFNKLLEGQVSINDFRIAANDTLAYLETIDGTCLDEDAEEVLLTHLRSLQISLNKAPRTFLQQQ